MVEQEAGVRVDFPAPFFSPMLLSHGFLSPWNRVMKGWLVLQCIWTTTA